MHSYFVFLFLFLFLLMNKYEIFFVPLFQMTLILHIIFSLSFIATLNPILTLNGVTLWRLESALMVLAE